ncbi:spore germination protein [Desulfitibacter alkalitolerans]|uniref:spore germination protein n=1 Tax=Desulfitibacter alkalitolerans TaxID=264641 RepID=UPI000480662E|nr:spore germination protein [Desulfitibacter alkalitolerans]
MFRKIFRLIKYIKLKSLNIEHEKSLNENKNGQHIAQSGKIVKEKLEQIFSDCSDFMLREIALGDEPPVKIIIACIDGLVNKQMVNADILKPLMIEARIANLKKELNNRTILTILKENLLTTIELQEIQDFQETIDAILAGDSVIYIEGKATALKAGSKGWEARGIEEPGTEAVVRGPREGFVESLGINISLLRRKIKNPRLKFEMMKLGKQSRTNVCICYIKDIANEKIIDTTRKRIKNIKTDAILESGYIEEFIEDAPFSIFPTVGNSEKPDVVAAKLLEGRVAVLCDGTPFVLTVPFLFLESIQSSEDYYSRSPLSSMIRALRMLALLISIILPGLYVAVVSFHYDIIPFKLLLTMMAARGGIPFSPFTEAFMMGVIFEILREAGVRMPRPIGQAVSIMGALVIGEATVKAGLISNPVVIVTALTAISSFAVPPTTGFMPFIRIILLIAANILGFMGMLLIIAVFLIHMCTLRSFGVSYLSPFSPLDVTDLKDTIIRVPIWAMNTRPRTLTWKDADMTKYRMKINFREKEK